MNLKRFLASTLALFVFFFFYEWFVHGHLLKGTYLETPAVWRDFSQVEAYMPWSLLYNFVTALWITFTFSRLFPEGGIFKGVQFGIYFGIFAGILSAAWSLWLAVNPTLAWCWFVSATVEIGVAGLITGFICKR